MKKILQWSHLPIMLLLIVNLTIGFATVKDYGESWDEESLFQYADQVLIAYGNALGQTDGIPVYKNLIEQYGPVVMVFTALVHKTILPGWLISEVSHLISFLCFQVGILAFYALARRWLAKWPAFGATLLLAWQPLLWGHAFINPKDIPFMAFFTLTVYLGFRAVDTIPHFESQKDERDLTAAINSEWGQIPTRTKKFTSLGILVGILGFAVAFGSIYLQQPWASLTPLAGGSHETVIELELYTRQLLNITFWILLLVFGLLSWITGVIAVFLPQTRKTIWQGEIIPLMSEFKSALTNAVLAAALVLGLTTAIRVLALSAGVLVGLYALVRLHRKAYAMLISYAGIAFFITVLAWPYLWDSPVARLLVSIKAMLQFPFPGKVLFGSSFYFSGEIPWNYLPTLIGIQITLPVLLLGSAGIAMIIYKFIQKQTGIDLGLVLGLWFGLPLLYAILFSRNFYDNFRQFLFILPPLLIAAGFILNYVWNLLRLKFWWAAILIVCLLPGVIGIIQLHPYEYVYYNQLAGGTGGAFRNYELDYWTTAYQEAARALNQSAPPDSTLLVWGPWVPVERVIREDIRVERFDEENPQDGDFALLPSRYNMDLIAYPEAQIVYTVERQGAILAVIKEIEP